MCEKEAAANVNDELTEAVYNVLNEYPIDLDEAFISRDHFLVCEIVAAVKEVVEANHE